VVLKHCPCSRFGRLGHVDFLQTPTPLCSSCV
jgi:hypothetical protein